jgi:hypothetical protein
MATNCHYFLHWNTTIEDDGMFLRVHFLFKHRKEGHGVVFFFFFLDIE